MILDSPDYAPASLIWTQFHWEYVEASEEEVCYVHYPVSRYIAACGLEVMDSGAIWLRSGVTLEDEGYTKCDECWRLLRENSGSLPSPNTPYRAEAGHGPGSSWSYAPPQRDRPEYGYFTVGLPTGTSIRVNRNHRTQWDTVLSPQQRQASIAAHSVQLRTYRGTTGAHPIWDIARVGTGAGSEVLFVGR